MPQVGSRKDKGVVEEEEMAGTTVLGVCVGGTQWTGAELASALPWLQLSGHQGAAFPDCTKVLCLGRTTANQQPAHPQE